MPPAAYDLADRLFQLAPWEQMTEITLIAIDQPESGRRDHISVMGMDGQHRSLTLYLGPVSRQRFNLIQERNLPHGDTLGLVLDTPQLQCSFSERADLFKSELAAIKQAGKKYRGENWPSFRSFRPGHCPVPANAEETRLLCAAIEQVLEIAPSLVSDDDDSLRYNDKGDHWEILTRSVVDGKWQTSWTPDDSSLFELPASQPEPFLLEKIRRHAPAFPLLVRFELIPRPIGKTRETSVFPYFLMVVEPVNGMILGFELLSVANQSYDDLIAGVASALLRLCDSQGIRPSSFATDSSATHALIAATAAALDIPCRIEDHLPALDEAFGSIMDRFIMGPDR